MKKGFTLAETLITLAIMGIVAAIIAPALVKLKPDNNKIQFLKVYDSLASSIRRLSGNTALFPVCQDDISCKTHPLINTSGRAMRNGYIIPDGNTKFCRLIAEEITNLSYNNIRTACAQMQNYLYSDNTFAQNAIWNSSGQQFIITTLLNKGEEIIYQTDIYFDINGAKKPNCIYSEECKEPDRFKLMIAANGTIIPADAAGRRYIIERKIFRKLPLEIAENTVVLEDNLPEGLRKFLPASCSTGMNEQGNNVENNQQDGENIYCGSTYNGRIINCMEEYIVSFKYDTYSKSLARVLFLQFPAETDITFIRFSYVPKSMSIEFTNGFEMFGQGTYYDSSLILSNNCSVATGKDICVVKPSLYNSMPEYSGSNWTDFIPPGGWQYNIYYDNKYIYLPVNETLSNIWDAYPHDPEMPEPKRPTYTYSGTVSGSLETTCADLLIDTLQRCQNNPATCDRTSGINRIPHNDYTNYKLSSGKTTDSLKDYLKVVGGL